ncbi:MAG TPA: Rrf2 family transcriptional regulator [Candidatus Dormibacteraeota bacterium]|nr:Rrf2 family transcriptional regulator [Candidatus Dormibacteraeota bacterium]
MDLTLSLRGDYVVRAALGLARAWETDGYRKIREITEEMALPASYTPQILGLLARAGLATARAGRDGGYRLSRSPEDITMLDVVEAGEGDLLLGRCTLRGGPCRWDDVCAVHNVWMGAAETLRSKLRATRLSDVAGADRSLETQFRSGNPQEHRLSGPGRSATNKGA